MKTCRRGHDYSSDKRQCPICATSASKRSHQRNREERSKASVRYFQKHKDKKAANNKLYWERHPEKVQEHKERFRKNNTLYSLWTGMINRCYRKADHAYPDYGGRGIEVCPEWRGPGGYKRFIADLPPRPSRRHTLDRIDNDCGYFMVHPKTGEKQLRWATREEQGSNRRTNRFVTICGKTKTLKQWARETGMSVTGFANRIKRGWSEEKLLQKANRRKQPQLNRERLLERVALTLYFAIGDMRYEGKDEVDAIMKEVGLLPNSSDDAESDGMNLEGVA